MVGHLAFAQLGVAAELDELGINDDGLFCFGKTSFEIGQFGIDREGKLGGGEGLLRCLVVAGLGEEVAVQQGFLFLGAFCGISAEGIRDNLGSTEADRLARGGPDAEAAQVVFPVLELLVQRELKLGAALIADGLLDFVCGLVAEAGVGRDGPALVAIVLLEGLGNIEALLLEVGLRIHQIELAFALLGPLGIHRRLLNDELADDEVAVWGEAGPIVRQAVIGQGFEFEASDANEIGLGLQEVNAG